MKMVAMQSIKFLRLKRRLKMPSWQVVGLLESIWLFTQSNAPAGDIGRHSDEDIAAHLEWEGDAEALVRDLVECGWLDRHETHRLVVHDWHEHAPNYVKGNMAKHGKGFATAESDQAAREAPREVAPHAEQVAREAPGEVALAACSTPVSTHHPRVGLSRDTNKTTHSLTREEPAPPLRTWPYPRNATEGIYAALDRWQAYQADKFGRPAGEVALESLVTLARSNGWDDDKIAKSVTFSIAKGARSWLDPDCDFQAAPLNGKAPRPKVDLSKVKF